MLLLPTCCYMKIFKGQLKPWEWGVNIAIVVVGVVGGTFGTIFSVGEIFCDVFGLCINSSS
jgi:hypothetical protein